MSAYLVPKLYSISGVTPDYINPDGTKQVLGDVVYYRDGAHHLGIEVKLGTVRLTRREFNDWIVSEDEAKWPCVFVGVGVKAIGVATWTQFRQAYMAVVRRRKSDWTASPILPTAYGPLRQVDAVVSKLPPESIFPVVADPDRWIANDELLTAALRGHLRPLEPRGPDKVRDAA